MKFDLVILGAGPAGLAAARAAIRAAYRTGQSVAVIDDNPAAGGQIWRGNAPMQVPPDVRFFPQTRVFDIRPGFVLETDSQGKIETSKIILATGARELFLPFPGWTSPGVFGAGGLQSLVKSGLSVKGKRVMVAGSGPLLLAVAATLRKQGARLVGIAEQAPLGRILPFLWRYPAKLPQAIGLKARLLGVRHWTGTWPVRFDGGVVTLSGGKTVRADYLACGFGLVPNTEVAQLLGCRLDDGFVAVDSRQETTVPGIYCAGEPTGIGGLDKALEEGERAGAAATGQALNRRRTHSGAFVRDLAATFHLDPRLFDLAEPGTVICRCEDVTQESLCAYREWREAKLLTRCGMGACQGRICGPITNCLFGWTAGSVRPPLVPVAADLLGQVDEN